MEDDGGMATTVVMKARSAYTWLDKLRFLKGLLPQDTSVDFSLVNDLSGSREGSHEVYKCSDLDVKSLEETCKVLFNAKQKLGSKSRKLCFMPKASEHIVKEAGRYTGQSDDGKASRPGNELVQVWEDSGRSAAEVAAVGSMNGAVEEDRFWMSGASERSDEAPTSVMSPKPLVVHRIGGELSPFKPNNRTARVTSFGTEPLARKEASKTAVTRNRRSIADLGSNIAAKTQKLHKFEETRVVTQEHRQQRSGLKRRQSSEENGTTSGKSQRQLKSVLEPAADQSKRQPAQVSELASDHPSKRPHDSLVYITYQVFLKAGRGGLTAREAASRIEEAGLGVVFQGLVKPRIKIGKIIRNNPYYFQAGEGRYILCEAIVGVTQATPSPLPPADAIVQEKPPQVKMADSRKEAAAMARREGTARYWAQMNASGRTRAPKSRHAKPGTSRPKPPPAPVHWKSDESCVSTLKEGNGTSGTDGTNGTNGTNGTDGTNGTNGTDGTNGTNGTHETLKWEEKSGKDELHELAVVQAHSKPRLKGMYKTAVGGKPCKRSDGKNWQCPLMAPANSNYCEHHQKRMTKDPAEL